MLSMRLSNVRGEDVVGEGRYVVAVVIVVMPLIRSEGQKRKKFGEEVEDLGGGLLLFGVGLFVVKAVLCTPRLLCK